MSEPSVYDTKILISDTEWQEVSVGADFTPIGGKVGKIVPPVVKTRPLDVPLPLMHAPLPCAILVSPFVPQDQHHVRDAVRVLHAAVPGGYPVEERRSGRSAPFILPAGTGISPDVVHLMGYRR
jgi:hypothetical protein